MVPDKFDMVDMGGIDLILMQGEEVPGLYNRLVESITQCRYQCLYNWLFDGVIIPPTYVEMEVGLDDEVRINEGVVVTSDDVIHIYTLEPILQPRLEITENGVYLPSEGYVGLESVDVNVQYTLSELSVTNNGVYVPPTGVYGFSKVNVSIETSDPLESVTVGDYLTGWYSNRKVTRVLESGPVLIPAIVKFNNSYRCGAFYTLVDYGVVGNVITGEYTSKANFTMDIPTLGERTVYYYGAMNGMGSNTSMTFVKRTGQSFPADNISTNVSMSSASIGPTKYYGPINATNYGDAYNAMSDELKSAFLALLLRTL